MHANIHMHAHTYIYTLSHILAPNHTCMHMHTYYYAHSFSFTYSLSPKILKDFYFLHKREMDAIAEEAWHNNLKTEEIPLF